MDTFYQLIKTIKTYDYDEKGNRIDVLMKVLKDEATGKKVIEIIEDPEFTYYVTKDEFELAEQVNYISKDMVRPVSVSSSGLVKSVAYEIGQEDFFWECIKNKKHSLAKSVFLDPNVHGSDIDLEDYYISEHYSQYPLEESKNQFTKSFFDIEVESSGIVGFAEPEDASCPVNAISFFCDSNMTLYGLFLRDSTNPLIAKFEDPENLKMFRAKIKQKYKDRGIDIKLKLKWYDEDKEANLIADFFDLINVLQPDFTGAWNLCSFDFKYLMNRLVNLNYNPADIICSEEVPPDWRVCYLNEDTRNQDFADNGSFVCVANYTNFLDMLLLFASLRKTAGKRESYSLDSIAFEELKENKTEWEDPETNVKNAARREYARFVEYNLHDTMLLYMLEEKNKDFNMIYAVAAKTETRVQKAMKKTVCLKNLARRFYYNRGYIMSNNHNTNYGNTNEKTKQEFRGAFVASPLLNKAIGLDINGKPSKFVFENVIDFDLTSLYPSIILAFNVDATTQIGQIQTDKFEVPRFMDDVISQQYANIGKKYFGLPAVSDMLAKLPPIKSA